VSAVRHLCSAVRLVAGLALAGCLAVSAGAQPAAAPRWRTAASVGLTDDGGTSVLSLGGDYAIGRYVAAGGRVALFAAGAIDDGPATEGGAFEGTLSAGTRLRAVDLRVFAGAGVATITTNRFEGGTEVGRITFGRQLLIAGVGLDVYPHPNLGVGAEARRVRSLGDPDLSEVSIGLRLRF
jgi:hypothetical protein